MFVKHLENYLISSIPAKKTKNEYVVKVQIK